MPVLAGMAEMSLNGKVEVRFSVNGLSWQLRCSARDILETNQRPPDVMTQLLHGLGMIR
jgi:hypothetical protein